MRKTTFVVVSGYFNPLHIGHIRYLKAAKRLGDKLIVIVNSDLQVALKGSTPFMPAPERREIIRNLKPVDGVIPSIDLDGTVRDTIEHLFGEGLITIFANGGDRIRQNIPEASTCKRLGIKLKFGVGGPKIQSSSKLLKNIKN